MGSSRLSELLLLGQGSDLKSERGVSCDGELPAASDPQLVERARVARAALGSRAMVLGHHYQRDEVIQFADITGDSFKLAQAAQDNNSAEFIFFCGVHFMAESADILTTDFQKVILPDLSAGCSMADMATAAQVNNCWEQPALCFILIEQDMYDISLNDFIYEERNKTKIKDSKKKL
jgi:quinolinate synthase